MDFPKHIAASFPYVVDGIEYTFSPLTNMDLASVGERIKTQRIDAIAASDLPADKKLELRLACEVTIGEIVDFLINTASGRTLMIYLSLLRSYPTMSFEHAGDLPVLDDPVLNERILNIKLYSPKASATPEPTEDGKKKDPTSGI